MTEQDTTTITSDETTTAERAVEHVMVYRCTLNDDSAYADDIFPRCGWSTTDYSEIDAHEDQIDPGHSVVGAVEAVPVKKATRG